MSVKSNYNFVPAPSEDEVFKPDWAAEVSHDIPFSDGESGTIEFTIQAKTPIFIRNGYAKDAEENEFSHLGEGEDKKYFIPGTSIKGMVRNVLEIITRSRMEKVNDHHHAVRQIIRQRGVIVNEGYELTGDEKKKITAGWLIQRGEEFFVHECEELLKVRYTDLDDQFRDEMNLDATFERQFGEALVSNMNEDFSAKTAKYKYENILNGQELEHHFEYHPRETDKQQSWVSIFQPLEYVEFSRDLGMAFKGHIVCTGQASGYHENNTARKGEYVFKGAKSELLVSSRNKLEVDENVMNTFLFINRDTKTDEAVDWGYWKGNLKTGIPVFFRKSKDGKAVKDMGLTFMYKQPVKASVKQSFPINTYLAREHDDFGADWAETIFGFTQKENSLKGRVMFSHAFQKEGQPVTVLPRKDIVLSSPRSSYFPFYMKQKGRNGRTGVYNTYNNAPSLSGFKRYPIRPEVKIHTVQEVEAMSADMITSFYPLDSGTKFIGKIRFHNLRKAEVGALISAITFHKKRGAFFHSLGYAKPLGYGKIKFDLGISEQAQQAYLKAFEFEMTKKENVNFLDNEAVKELLAMAMDAPAAVQSQLDYMPLDDFKTAKERGEYLERYSKIANVRLSFDAQLSEAERATMLSQQNQREQKLLAEQAAAALAVQKLKDALAAEAFAKAVELDTMDAYENFLVDYPESKHVEKAELHIKLIEDREKQGFKQEKAESWKLEAYQKKSLLYQDVKKWPNEKMENEFFEFSPTHLKDIEAALKECFVLENSSRRKKTNNFFDKKGRFKSTNASSWDDIKKWFDADTVTRIYNEFSALSKNK